MTHNGTSYSLIYDALGRSKQTKIGTRLLVDNMYFAESGLLRKAAYGNGNTREYEYDRQGRVKKMIIDGVDRFSYTYDSQGNLLSYTDLVANEKFTYVYDFLGRPVQVRTSSGFKIKLTYDEFNRASDVEFVNGTESNKTSWVFGNDSIVTGVKYNGVEKISYTYDLLKRQTAKTINTTNPFVTQYQYKNIYNYRTSTLIDKISYSDGTALSYTYDANGNILTIADATGTVIASYTYDSLNQLTGATVGSDVYVYTYDNGGNITAKTKNGVEVAYTYGNTEWKDLLTNYNGVDIAYDTIGNPLNWINGETFTWGGGRQLTGIVKGDNTISYTYNDSGIRTSKTVNGVRTDYYLNGTAIIMQKTGDNVIWYTYDENGLKTGFTCNGTAYYYVYNLQGDVIALLNSAGETVARYDYDPWGKIIAITDGQGNDISAIATHIANINPIRYRGYYYDIETGLYYLQSRYYDAEVGRFLNADGYMSTGQGVLGYNMFAYCGNNPVNLNDIAGTIPVRNTMTMMTDGGTFTSKVLHLEERREVQDFYNKNTEWFDEVISTCGKNASRIDVLYGGEKIVNDRTRRIEKIENSICNPVFYVITALTFGAGAGIGTVKGVYDVITAAYDLINEGSELYKPENTLMNGSYMKYSIFIESEVMEYGERYTYITIINVYWAQVGVGGERQIIEYDRSYKRERIG